MTPEEFKTKMQSIPDYPTDKEAAHSEADDLMCDLLEELGYGEGVAVFRAMEKFYA